MKTVWDEEMVRWKNAVSLEELNHIGMDTASENFGIQFVDIGEDWLEATIPLDVRTQNASGNLHPGALGVLAETIGSVAASLCIDKDRQMCVSQSLHVNHPTSIPI